MIQDFKKALDLITSSERILLTMHERMDGDDGGSVLALLHQLEKMGKNVEAAIKKGVPKSLSFLPGSHKITDDIIHENYDLVITCGCSLIERTGSEKIKNLTAQENVTKTINIDHHPDNKNFGHVNLVDPSKSSVAELVYDFFIYNKWPISKEVAACLLTGIITDTGSFMHSNTQSSTLNTAAELIRKGARINKIINHTYKSKGYNILKAWGKAIENFYFDKKTKIIYSVMTESDLTEFKNLPQSAFEGLAETLNTVPEAKFAMFLRQDGNVIKGSLRSDEYKNTDVALIAKNFGGGGHKLAAGFSVAGKLVKEKSGEWKVQ